MWQFQSGHEQPGQNRAGVPCSSFSCTWLPRSVHRSWCPLAILHRRLVKPKNYKNKLVKSLTSLLMLHAGVLGGDAFCVDLRSVIQIWAQLTECSVIFGMLSNTCFTGSRSSNSASALRGLGAMLIWNCTTLSSKFGCLPNSALFFEYGLVASVIQIYLN